RTMSGRLLKIQKWEALARQADFRPAKMAVLCLVSHRQLQRHFEQHHQTTPRKWLRKLQCRMAKQLISQGYSSKAVALDLKFSNPTHFCREFRKVFGAPPQSFAPGTNIDQTKVSLQD